MAGLLVLPCLFAIEPYDEDTPRFLLSTFRNAEQDKLYLTASFDGREYSPLTGSYVYEETDGNQIRDPSIIRYRGMWYICHTSGTELGNASYFRILSSEDLVNWTHIKDVSMEAVPNTHYTWAPEWYLEDDGSLHVFVSVSRWPTQEHVFHEIHPVDPNDLAGEWSAPARLTGPAFPDFEPLTDENGVPINGRRVGTYDAYVIKRQGVYHIWYFNRSTSSLAHATAPALLGPYTADVTSNLYGTGVWKEGQTMTHLGGTSWRFTYANATTSRLWYVESSNDWATWTAPAPLGSPDGMIFNHGTVVSNPSVPRFQTEIVGTSADQLQMVFPSLKQNGYRLQWSENLIDWNDEGDVIEGDGSPIEIELSLGSEQRMFYRMKWLPFW